MRRSVMGSLLGALAVVGWSLFALGCSAEGPDTGIVYDTSAPPTFTDEEKKAILSLSPLPAIPASPSNQYADDPKAAAWGQALFFDKGLSRNGEVACATCHDPSAQWSEQKGVSVGLSQVDRHAPTLWNVAYNRWYNWDGKADSLWAQALGPFEDDREMGMSRLELLHAIASQPKHKAAYEEIFGKLPDVSDTSRFPQKGRPIADKPDDPLNKAWQSMAKDDQDAVNRFFANLGKAIEAYQRKIISKESPFDTFVQGVKEADAKKQEAISHEAKWGLRVFLAKDSCIGCHNGPNFTDREFHNIGLGANTALSLEPDIGRFDGIPKVLSNPFNGIGAYSDDPDHPEFDKLRFLNDDPRKTANTFGEMKTPTLRNVALSGPYMHDGRFKTLEEVIDHYSTFGAQDPSACLANVQAIDQPDGCKLTKAAIGHREETMLILKLSPSQRSALIAFLKTLTGKPLAPALLKAP